MNPLELRRKRAGIIEQMRALINTAQNAGRGLTSSEESRYKDMEAEVKRLDGDIQREEGLRSLEADLNEPLDAPRAPVPPSPTNEPSFVDSKGREIRALRPEERVADHVRREGGDDFSEPLSFGRYIRGAVTGDWSGAEPERRAMKVADDVLGGYVVPSRLSAEIIDLARNKSVCLQAGARTLLMDSSTLDIALVTQDPVAVWRGESEPITSSDVSFGLLRLHAKTLAAMVKCSIEIIEDASNLDQTVTNAISQALALELDRTMLLGEGTPVQPRGLAKTEGVNTITLGTGNGAVLQSVTPFFQAREPILMANGQPTAAIMSPREEVWLESLRDGEGRYLLPPESWTRLKRLSSNQIPCDLVEGESDNASIAIIGDFSRLLLGMRTALTVEISREAGDTTGSAFQNLEVWIRAYLRADVAVSKPSHFSIIEGIIPDSGGE
jgi:HK97 family phage major capsid protein